MSYVSVEEITASVSGVVTTSLTSLAEFLPSFVGGLVVFTVGIIVSTIVNRVIRAALKAIKFEDLLKRYGLSQVEGREVSWTDVLAELARWSVIIVFLIPTLSVWGIGQANEVLAQILSYIPNVAVAVIIALVGLVFANLAHDAVLSASKSLGRSLAHTGALVARWAIVVFVSLVVLNQLGIGADLIRILFTGLVAFLAIAGGLAFGLGGSDVAKDLLNQLRERFKR